jgi:DegV family protein with EDD domain
MAVKIFTDSGSDFTPAEAGRLGIEIVPMYIFYGNERLRDGVDIDAATFNRRTAAGEPAKTEPASVEDFRVLFERSVSAGHDVVMITISKEISKANENARAAAAAFPGKVYVVDSKGASGLECLLAQRALEYAAAGEAAESIAKRIDPSATKNGIFFAVPDMSPLGRSGRIPKAIIALGSMLNVSLVLKMNEHGAVAPAGQSFSFDKTLDLMVEAIVRAIDRNPRARFAIAHVGSIDRANGLAASLERKLGHPPAELTIRDSGLTIAANLGHGAIGIYAIVP